MTLAASGTMSLAGTETDRSVQVELGGDGTTQMSMNDAAVRELGGQETAGSAINMSTDFYGASTVSGITARYWRFTKFIPNQSGSFLTRMELYTGFAGGGSTLCTTSNINRNYDGYNSTYNYLKVLTTPTYQGWWLLGQSAANQFGYYIGFDLGSATEVKSFLISVYGNGSYGCSSMVLQSSTDNTNWTDRKTVTFGDSVIPAADRNQTIDLTLTETDLTVTEGTDIFSSAAYYGFREERNPDVGSVSPTSLTFDGKTHPLRDAYRRVNRSGGVNNDSTSAFWFILYNASDGTAPADDWFSSLTLQTSGDSATLTPAEATIVTSGSGSTGRKEWRFFSSDFTATELTNFSTQWDGTGTSTVTFTE